jgi:hypothetical protein
MTDKIYTDKHGTEIKKGSIVKYNDPNGEMRKKTTIYEDGPSTVFTLVPRIHQGRITRITSKWANIGGVWSGKVFDKKVPLTELTECGEEFYDNWTKSDAYRCM